LSDGQIVTCTPTCNRELFLATCGGMGLTGIIVQASLYLKRVSSQFIDQTTIKTRNLRETFEAFEEYAEQPYSVAWIDCLSKGEALGCSLLMVGDFFDEQDFNYQDKRKLSVPFNLPSFTLNSLSLKTFNALYYGRAKSGVSQQRVDVDSFFYPLDAIGHWNRIYGRKGFTQYQFILPKARSFDGLKQILELIAESGQGSFLAVLKLYGPANENYLSFPLEGYSLALDFKINSKVFALLDNLDEIVVDSDGRIYLTKDARVCREVFERGYPKVDAFRKLRRDCQLDQRFQSLQSQRLGL